MPDVIPRLLRSWWLIAGAVALGLGAAAFLTLSADPLFVATSRVYVSVRTQPDSASLNQASQFSRQQVASYAQVVTSPLVLGPVVGRLNLEQTPPELAGRITVSSPEDTSVISVDVTGADARQTALIANGVAEEFVRQLAALERPSTARESPIRATIIQRGVVPSTAVSPKPAFNAALGLLVGLLLGVVAALARDSRDHRVRGRTGLGEAVGVSVLGAVPLVPAARSAGGLVSVTRGEFDEFRRIRAALAPRLERSGGTSVLVTSPLAGDGKTTLVAGLAAAFAEDGSRVVVVDADLAGAALSRRLGADSGAGLAALVSGGARPEDVLVPMAGFDLLPAGSTHGRADGQLDGRADGPVAVLHVRALHPVIEKLQAGYDVVLLDTPAVRTSSDAVRLSPAAALTVLVASTRGTTVPGLRQAVRDIDGAGGRVAGLVVNHARPAGSTA
jgi:capsular polysaccharide biosynthesis protein/Mrp family chromosome partitioning ATPase